MEAAGGTERVGELAADLGDLPDRDERRHREQRHDGQDRGIEAPVHDEQAAGRQHREAAEPGDDLVQRRL